jgi:hypothetical protein
VKVGVAVAATMGVLEGVGPPGVDSGVMAGNLALDLRRFGGSLVRAVWQIGSYDPSIWS